MPRQRAAAEGSDVEALMELLSGATERIDALETGHRKLQRRIADLERESGVGTTFTRAAKTREKIMETFRAMPAGWKLTSSTIVANLEGDEVDANAVRYQLGRLVSQGQLQVAGERASAQYSLAPLDGGS